jgi:hypothetical protein
MTDVDNFHVVSVGSRKKQRKRMETTFMLSVFSQFSNCKQLGQYINLIDNLELSQNKGMSRFYRASFQYIAGLVTPESINVDANRQRYIFALWR